MERYFYNGEQIEYCGFMIDDYYCFQYVGAPETDPLIYLSRAKIDSLQKV